MFKRSLIVCLQTLLPVALCCTVKGQSVYLRETLTAISTYNQTHTPEKIFIHTDKWNYNKEDTLRFKAYVFDAGMAATRKSGLMYIEIADADNKVVNRNMVRLAYGIGCGNIPLSEVRYPEGTYTLRAYTNWMRNFDEHYIYSRQFTIEGAMDEDWMINSRFDLTEQEGLSNIKSNLAFIKNNGSRLFGEELRMRITAGKRTLYNTKLTTGVDGTLDFDFNLPAQTSAENINIALTKRTKRAQDVVFNVPVVINRDEKTDLQFMPEGGHMVAGLLSRVGFKAINEEGKGIDIRGIVYNNSGKKVADLNSIHKGMGWFELMPQSGETYTAKITYHNKQLSFLLPAAKASGVIMSVENVTGKDSITVTINPSTDVQHARSYFYLVGQSRNNVCYGAIVNARNGLIKLSAPKSAFATGVARFTLLSAQNQPVAERVVFVDHNDAIRLVVTSSKPIYDSRDSVCFEMMATDVEGNALTGSFSVAVTDDAQVRPDTSGDNDMPAKLLFHDDVQGPVENPGWYFANANKLQKAPAIDALMLTQGWVKYNWQEVFGTNEGEAAYKPEPDFVVSGRVVNAFKKPLSGSNIVLFSTNPTFVADTTTNKEGEFRFTSLHPFDTVAYNLQAKNKRGRLFNVGIEIDKFVPPIFNKPGQRLIPLYVNIDTSRLKAIRTRQLYKEEELKITGTQLKEVQIKAKKAVKDSKSLVGAGEADFTLNDEDLKPQGSRTVLDILRENVKGFSEMRAKGIMYNINGVKTMFIVDGVSAAKHITRGVSYHRYITNLLNYINAEDVKGIEVMTTAKNQGVYTHEYAPGATPIDITFIEITTYSGYGLMFKKEPGNYLYRPPVFASTKEFYSPRYAVKKPVVVPDTRSTIFWAPNVVTDNNGKASVSFYTADKTATYTISIQGADMEGSVGAAYSKLYVKKTDGNGQ